MLKLTWLPTFTEENDFLDISFYLCEWLTINLDDGQKK